MKLKKLRSVEGRPSPLKSATACTVWHKLHNNVFAFNLQTFLKEQNLDPDGDGRVTFAEFCDALMNAKF